MASQGVIQYHELGKYANFFKNNPNFYNQYFLQKAVLTRYVEQEALVQFQFLQKYGALHMRRVGDEQFQITKIDVIRTTCGPQVSGTVDVYLYRNQLWTPVSIILQEDIFQLNREWLRDVSFRFQPTDKDAQDREQWRVIIQVDARIYDDAAPATEYRSFIIGTDVDQSNFYFTEPVGNFQFHSPPELFYSGYTIDFR